MAPLGSDPRCYPAGVAGETVPEAVIGGAGAWHVPTAAKERAPHGGLRCSGSMYRRLGVSLEDLSARYRSASRLPRPARVISGWSVPQRRPPHVAQRLKRTAAPYERRDENRRLASAAEVRALSEVFSARPPFEGLQTGPSVVKSRDRPLESPASDCGSTTEVFHSLSTARWG